MAFHSQISTPAASDNRPLTPPAPPPKTLPARWTPRRVLVFQKYELRASALDHWERAVLRELVWFVAERTHLVSVHQETLARALGCGTHKAREALASLIGRGVITPVERRGKSHAYVYEVAGPDELVRLRVIAPPLASLRHELSSDPLDQSKTVSSDPLDQSKSGFDRSIGSVEMGPHHLSDRSLNLNHNHSRILGGLGGKAPHDQRAASESQPQGGSPVVVVVRKGSEHEKSSDPARERIVAHWWKRLGQPKIGGTEPRGSFVTEVRAAVAEALAAGNTEQDCVDAVDGVADPRLGGHAAEWCRERHVWADGVFRGPLVRLVAAVREARTRAQKGVENRRSEAPTEAGPIDTAKARQAAAVLAQMGCRMPATLQAATAADDGAAQATAPHLNSPLANQD
jgi:hypothetical protein